MGLAHQLQAGEEIGDFDHSGFRRVRAMHGIGFDALGEFLADGAGRGIGRVGGAHHVAVFGNGALAFQHLHNHGAGDHEADQVVEEGPRLVHAVEALGLGLGHLNALLGDDAQAGLLDGGVDGAGQVAAGGIRLDDGKGALDGHGS